MGLLKAEVVIMMVYAMIILFSVPVIDDLMIMIMIDPLHYFTVPWQVLHPHMAVGFPRLTSWKVNGTFPGHMVTGIDRLDCKCTCNLLLTLSFVPLLSLSI